MVQYIHTPWRDRAELLKVRQQFYPAPPDAKTVALVVGSSTTSSTSPAATIVNFADTPKTRTETDQRRHAVSRVAMWVQRGSCPHMVESTGLLMAAILDDLLVHEGRSGTAGTGSTSAVRLAYSAAFSRFVTGLLDSHQDKQMKQSMYSIAKTIGLPATFVELRHQCTHEQLPSLLKLRSAAQKSLIWIWDYYWRHLSDDDSGAAAAVGEVGSGNSCREALSAYLLADDAARKSLEKQLQQWDESTLLRTLDEIGESAEDPRLMLRSLQFSQEILDGKLEKLSSSRNGKERTMTTRDVDMAEEDIVETSSGLQTLQSSQSIPTSKGWSRYEGTWKAKPIGIV